LRERGGRRIEGREGTRGGRLRGEGEGEERRERERERERRRRAH